jgi:hypothetical protein
MKFDFDAASEHQVLDVGCLKAIASLGPFSRIGSCSQSHGLCHKGPTSTNFANLSVREFKETGIEKLLRGRSGQPIRPIQIRRRWSWSRETRRHHDRPVPPPCRDDELA